MTSGSALAGWLGGRARPRPEDVPLDRFEQTIDLVRGVVVHEPDPQESAVFGQAETLDQPGRIEVAMPCRDPFVTEVAGQGRDRDSIDGDRRRRRPLLEPPGVDDAVQAHTGNA
jgi:hypothetical protein